MLAANQGLYNGFLGAGLAWGLVRGRRHPGLLPGLRVRGRRHGAATANRKILFVQALPALVAGVALYLA